MNRPRLAILDDYEGMLAGAPAITRFREIADVDVFNKSLEVEELVRSLCDYQILVATRERTQFTAELLEKLPKLELLVQTGGHAYHVDLEAASRMGILVALGNRTQSSYRATPELVFGLIIALLRHLPALSHTMKEGGWPISVGRILHGRTLGVLGLGRVGVPVSRLGRAFGMRVVAWGPTLTGDRAKKEGVTRLSLDELLGCSDIVSVHLRLSEQSRGLLDRRRLSLMRSDAILINTSRGAIVDEAALVDALESNHLAGAGLDVYSSEPLAADSSLRRLPNVVLTPHIGWTVDAVFEEFMEIACEQVEDYLRHNLRPTDIVNCQALTIQRERLGGVDVS